MLAMANRKRAIMNSTKKIEITYFLTKEGQKQNITAGGDGNCRQVIYVDATDYFSRLAKAGVRTIREIGSKTEELNKQYYQDYLRQKTKEKKEETEKELKKAEEDQKKEDN